LGNCRLPAYGLQLFCASRGSDHPRKKVVEGEGLDSYHTFWEVEFNCIGVLVLFGCIPVALVVGALWRLREYLQWRDLERKYRGGKRDS